MDSPRPHHPASLRVATDQAEAQSSVAAVWREHRRWVSAVVLAHMPRDAELDDLVQEVAVRLVAHAHELRDRAALRPWLRTVAMNVARSAGRRARVRKGEGALEHDPGARAGDGAHDGARRNDVLEAALSLPDPYREALVLRALRGLSYKQIADTVGVPVTTIETRLVRARRMLRDALEDTSARSKTP